MVPFKARVNNTTSGEMTTIKGNAPGGWSLTVQAVYYSSNNPGQFLHLYDADGDEFMFPIPGQGQPKTVNPPIPVTVKLPIRYMDISQGGNEIRVWGKAEKIPQSGL